MKLNLKRLGIENGLITFEEEDTYREHRYSVNEVYEILKEKPDTFNLKTQIILTDLEADYKVMV